MLLELGKNAIRRETEHRQQKRKKKRQVGLKSFRTAKETSNPRKGRK